MVVHGIQAFSAARLQYSMTDYMFKPFLFGLNPPDVRRCDTVLYAPLLDIILRRCEQSVHFDHNFARQAFWCSACCCSTYVLLHRGGARVIVLVQPVSAGVRRRRG